MDDQTIFNDLLQKYTQRGYRITLKECEDHALRIELTRAGVGALEAMGDDGVFEMEMMKETRYANMTIIRCDDYRTQFLFSTDYFEHEIRLECPSEPNVVDQC